jgi:hypothetical protein
MAFSMYGSEVIDITALHYTLLAVIGEKNQSERGLIGNDIIS